MRRRNCRVEIYLTPEELEILTQKVRKAGLSREQFCRCVLSGAEVKEAPSADVLSLIREMRRRLPPPHPCPGAPPSPSPLAPVAGIPSPIG